MRAALAVWANHDADATYLEHIKVLGAQDEIENCMQANSQEKTVSCCNVGMMAPIIEVEISNSCINSYIANSSANQWKMEKGKDQRHARVLSKE